MAMSMAINLGAACLLAGVFIALYVRARRTPEPGRHELYPTEKAPLPPPPAPDHAPSRAMPVAGPLPPSVLAADEHVMERGEWVQRITSHVYDARHGRRYNVLTIHANIDYHFAPAGVVERIPVLYNESRKARVIPYDIYVFQRGNLVRLGDGGYINWCFQGNFDRQDEFVTFKDVVV